MAENGILDYQGMNQAIYRGATSNIIVDTQSMSIEIGAGNSSHTSNLHIECDHDANVASIQLNSNVVTEFSRSKKLIKYPRVALTSDNQPTGYVASASSNYPDPASSDPWQAFDNIWDPDGSGANSWESHSSSFASGTTYIGPRSSTGLNTFDSNNGEYLNIKLPEKIVLQRYKHTTRANRWWEGPYSGFLYGSNDGFTTYDKIHTFSAIELSSEASYIHTVNTTTAYNEYRFHVTQTQASVYLSICLFDLFGTPEYDPEAHGTDVTVKSYPNVPNTDWLEVYYDAKGLPNGAVTNPISGLGGTTINGTATNVTVSDGAFVFDGNGDYIETTLGSHISGDWTNTVSFWIVWNAIPTSGAQTPFMIGQPNTSTNGIGVDFNANGNMFYFTTSGDVVTINNVFDLITPGKWIHFTFIHTPSKKYVYWDGKQVGIWTSGGAATLPTSPTLSIGRRGSSPTNYTNAKMANFRLFNRALTSDEIYQLYAYQKEDFGHSTNNMTLKAGRLGIGTSEPRAALDVRGDVKFSGMPNMTESIFFYIDGNAGDNYPNYQNTHAFYQNKFIPPGIGSYGVDQQWYTTSQYTSTTNDLFKSHFDTMVYWLKNAPIGHVHKLNWVTNNNSCHGTTFGQKNNGTQIRLWGYFPAYNTGYNYGHNKLWNDALIFNMSSATELVIFYDGYTISN
jgi:hypothetical protein